MGILGDISSSRPSGSEASAKGGSDKTVRDLPLRGPEEGGASDKSVQDLPLRTPEEGAGAQTELEMVPATETVGASEHPSPAAASSGRKPNQPSAEIASATVASDARAEFPSAASVNQQRTAKRDTKREGLDDPTLRGAHVGRSEDGEVARRVHTNQVVARTASYLSRSGKDADEQQDGAAAEPAEPGRQGPKGASKALWGVVVLLALALAGLTGYGYLTMRQNGLALSRLPGVEQLVGILQSRLNATEAKLQDLTANWASLSQQVAALNSKVRSSIESSRRHAEELIVQEQERIEAEMAKREQVVNARLTRVESQQQADNQRLTQVQDWVQKNVAAVRQDVAVEREDRGRDTSALRQDVGQSRNDLQDLAQKVERQRVDFEAAKNKQQELAPGISLTVTRTDARYQRFEGYLELLEDSRTLWLSKVSAQQAVPFYLKQGGQPYDLIVETVKRNGVVGYLLVPEEGRSQQRTGKTASEPPAAQRPLANLF